MAGSKSLRRSPRFPSNYPSAAENGRPLALTTAGEKMLRRSPRTSTRLSSPILGISPKSADLGADQLSKKPKVSPSPKEKSRLSNACSPKSADLGAEQPSKRKIMAEERILRRSPRTSSRSSSPSSGISPKSAGLGFVRPPEKPMASSSPKKESKSSNACSPAVTEEKILRRSPRTSTQLSSLTSDIHGVLSSADLTVEQRSKKRKVSPSPKSKSKSNNAGSTVEQPSKKPNTSPSPSPSPKKKIKSNNACFFVGDPIPIERARQLWPHRYEEKLKTTAFELDKPHSSVVIVDPFRWALGEVLQSSAAACSNSASPQACNSSKSPCEGGLNLLTDGCWGDEGSTLERPPRLDSSPSGVLHRTLVSPSASSSSSSPTFTAAKSEIALKWLCNSKSSS